MRGILFLDCSVILPNQENILKPLITFEDSLHKPQAELKTFLNVYFFLVLMIIYTFKIIDTLRMNLVKISSSYSNIYIININHRNNG